MGHQFARPAAAAAVVALALTACGSSDETTDLPPVLDNAREQVAGAAGSTAPGTDPVPADPATEIGDVDELPAPDPSEFEGANRVVNLWVGGSGETQVIDVWGRRTFTNGPILLVEGLAFGEASDYFSAPPGYSLAIVGNGAGPDGAELAGMFNAVEGEQITVVYTNDDERGTVSAPHVWERDLDGRSGTPAPPKPDMGLVSLLAPNTRSFGYSLTASLGSDSFYVGDGAGSCRQQRVEDEGFQANILGGTQSVQLDLPPGPATISLHEWPSLDECAGAAVAEFAVDVAAGRSLLVLVYSSDGETLETLQLPIE